MSGLVWYHAHTILHRMVCAYKQYVHKKWAAGPRLILGLANIVASMQAFLILKETVGFVGNRTECALLMMLRAWGLDYKAIRDQNASMVQKVWDFDSAKKMASVMIKTQTGFRLFNKASAQLIPSAMHA